MKYDELYKSFKEEFPNGQAFFEKMEKEHLVDNTVGMHLAFGLIVVPYILQTVNEKKLPEIKQIFAFLEKMAVCKDAEISGVLDFTVLEHLVDEGHEFIRECKKYMGPNTTEHCDAVAKYFL